MTEAWFRNPDNYIRELVEVGVHQIAWDRGVLVKKKINPIKHAELYFGRTYPWRILLVGEQGTAEYRDGYRLELPAAVYPTWVYGEDAALLEEIVARPVGEDADICSDMSVPADERPIFGQEHRVVVTNVPSGTTGVGRKFLSYLKELQEDYPKCIIHLHGAYSWRIAFGMGYRSADVEPRTSAQKGKILLPNGREVLYERAQSNAKWVTVLGFKPAELSVPRVRCMYNIKSALWAAENYDKLYNFRVNNVGPVDYTSPDSEHDGEVKTGAVVLGHKKPKEGDKFHCDTCSLQNDCKYFRSGAVCSLPNAEPKALATFFKTRDSNTIIEGLGTLVAANARRLERGMEEETDFGELNPEVGKTLNQVFQQGVQLAKLLDPALRSSGAKVQVNVGAGGAAAVSVSSPRQLIATAIRELESQGIPREKITSEMIQGLIEGIQNPELAQRAIEGSVVSSRVVR